MASPASPDPMLPLPMPPGRAAASRSPTPPPASPLPMPPGKAASPASNLPLPKPPALRGGGNSPKPADRTKKTTKIAIASPVPSPNVKAQPPKPKLQKRSRRRCSCCSCCLWTTLALVGLALALVLAGALLFMSLKPELPQFRIEKLAISSLDSLKNADLMYLSTDIDLFVAILNKNDDIVFDYKEIKVYLTSDDVNLGRAEIVGFSQLPNNLTIVKLHTGVANSLVAEGDGRRLKGEFEQKNLVLDVEIQGQMNAAIGKMRSSYLTIKVRCLDVDPSRVALGIEAKCEIYLLGWIPLK